MIIGTLFRIIKKMADWRLHKICEMATVQTRSCQRHLVFRPTLEVFTCLNSYTTWSEIMNRWICGILSPLLLVMAGGCSTYVDGYYFAPRPAVAQISTTPPPQAQSQPYLPPVAVTYASVIGIHRGDRQNGIPPSVQVRLRLENHDTKTLVLDPRTTELIDGGLVSFPAPVVRPPGPLTAGPMQSVIADFYFPFNPGRSWENTDLSSLQLHWDTQIEGQSVSQAVEFRRIFARYYYRPYWGDPPIGFYGGVVIIHRR